MSSVICPYCGEKIIIDTSDDYEVDTRYTHECPDCEKTFVLTLKIHYEYQGHKADCQNGADHALKLCIAYPKQYSRMRCRDCDYSRKPTPEEFAAIGR